MSVREHFDNFPPLARNVADGIYGVRAAYRIGVDRIWDIRTNSLVVPAFCAVTRPLLATHIVVDETMQFVMGQDGPDGTPFPLMPSSYLGRKLHFATLDAASQTYTCIGPCPDAALKEHTVGPTDFARRRADDH